MKDRDSALRKATRTKDPKDKKAARLARNKVNTLIRVAKNNFIKGKLENFRDNPKKFWEQIKSVMPTSNFSNAIFLENNLGQKLNNKEAADKVNKYFTNIGSELALKIQQNNINIPPPPPAPAPALEPKLVLHQPTQENIQKWVKNIKVFKSSGLPKIASRIWKLLFTREQNLLNHVIECIFSNFAFPQKWKSATIIPIPKVSKVKGPEDLRPISLLPLPGKIVEHLLYTQIDAFLERHDLLTDKQNGFRTKRSTIKTIFSFTSELTQIYNCDKDTIALYIDFKKAFDTVNHTKLIKKCKSFNFDENLIKLLSSYLTQRKQSTCMNGECSEPLTITYGVPQGSVLGPKLFLLYINDLTHVIQNCKFFLYADDIVLFKEMDKNQVARSFTLLQEDVTAVANWCKVNELTINLSKTKAQFFPKSRNVDCDSFETENVITIDTCDISYVPSFKYLGVEIDRNLCMKGQYEYLFKLVNHKLFLLRTIRPCLTIKAAVDIARSMILSLIDYGNVFLTCCTQANRQELQTLQNKILRCCLNIEDPLDMNIIEMHNMLNLDFVDKRRNIQLLTLVRSHVLENKFPMVNHERETRHNDGLKIKLPIPKNQQVKNTPYYTGASFWNNLPLDVRELDYSKFLSEIKTLNRQNRLNPTFNF